MARNDDDVDVPQIEGDGDSPQKGKKLLLIIIVLLVLLGGAGAGLYFSGMADELLGGGSTGSEEEVAADEPAAEAAHGAASGEHGAPGKPGEGPVFYPLPEFIINLNTTGTNAGTSFMKITVVLELSSEEVQKKVVALEPRIIDDFNTYLRELRASDLAGSAGIYRLREELILRMNKMLHPDQVNDVLFKEILVQ